MSEGFQIEIPSLDEDDDFANTPIPFGRPQNFQQQSFGQSPNNGGFGSFGSSANWDASGSPADSFHARADSFTSEHSSFGHTKSNLSFSATKSSSSGHGPTPSTTTASAPSRKSSFASIKNAFRTAKLTTAAPDVPPVPQLDSNIALRNPFNRTTSARAFATPQQGSPIPVARRRPSAPGSSMSYQGGAARSPQSYSPAPREHARGISNMSGPSSHKGVRGVLQHSPASSLNQSDPDHLAFTTGNGGPIPRVANASASFHRPAGSVDSEIAPTPAREPSTPAEYALNVVLTHFVTNAERRIEDILQSRLDVEILLPDAVGPKVDAEFDTILDSFGRVALKQAKLAIEAITRWRRDHTGDRRLPDSVIRHHMPEHVDRARRLEINEKLLRRREMTATYVYCRALIAVVSTLSRESLDDAFAVMFQDLMFNEYLRAEDSSPVPSPNQRAIAESFSTILGHLAKARFLSVTDHFVDELVPVSNGLVPRDGDPRFEHLVNGLRSLELKVWPHERFEEASELVESLAPAFNNAHGSKLKVAFAETLTLLLHGINKDAQEELDEPQWAQAMEVFHTKAMQMLLKPRYQAVAYPLAITSLCVSSQDYFARNWAHLCDVSLSKLKERSQRVVAYNGLTRLIWTYIFRNRDSNSTKSAKLEGIMRHLLGQGRKYADDGLEPLVYVSHFIMSRANLQYGQDLAMELLQESNLPGINHLGEIQSPDQVAVGIRATMLSLPCLVNGTRPIWPSSPDFSLPLSPVDYPLEATSLSAEALNSSEDVALFVDRFGAAVSKLGRLAIRSVGSMSVLDSRYRFDHTLSLDEREQLVILHHPDGTILAFPKTIMPQLELLRSCFETWPRCIHSAFSPLDAIDGAIRAVAHADPSVAAAATQCLLRFSAERRYVLLVLKLYARSLFSPASLSADPNWRIVTEHTQRVALWVKLVQSWDDLSKEEVSADEAAVPPDPNLPTISPVDVIDQIEGGGLFLLASTDVSVRPFGLKVLRLLPAMKRQFMGEPSPTNTRPTAIIEVLTGSSLILPMPNEGSLALSDQEAIRLTKWRESGLPHYLVRLLESDNPLDHLLWTTLLPSLMGECVTLFPVALDLCRNSLNAAVMRYHPMISALAGMSSSRAPVATARGPITPSRGPGGMSSQDITNEQRNDVGQWRVWIMALCACAVSDDRPPIRDHARVSSDATTSGSRDKLSTARGLFRHLIPFLASEVSLFRDAVVSALGCTHAATFRTLLDDLRTITPHLYDDGKQFGLSKQPGGNRRTREQDRVHMAVVRVYALTAEFINHSAVYQDPTTVSMLWAFVRTAQNFLSRPDVRADWTLNRLRRYFCHIVEQLFSVPTDQLREVVPSSAYLGLFRLCEEWCPYGNSDAFKSRQSAISSSIGSTFRSSNERKQAVDRLRSEESVLGAAAASAMACLCTIAFFSVQDTNISPTQSYDPPLTVPSVIEWIGALLTADNRTYRTIVSSGRKALRSFLHDEQHNGDLMHAIVRKSFVELTQPSSVPFFEETMDAIISRSCPHFSYHQSLWLGLVHLTHKDSPIRTKALKALQTVHIAGADPATIARIHTMVRSPALNVHVEAQLQLSHLIAETYPQGACGTLAECTLRLPQHRDSQERHALLSLEPWLGHINLVSEQGSLTVAGSGALHNLFSLTVRYSDAHADVFQLLWSRLIRDAFVCIPIVDVLLQEAAFRANPSFIGHSGRILSYLARTPLGSNIFSHLCSVITPESIAPPSHTKSPIPPGEDEFFVEDLSGLLPVPKNRHHFSSVEIAVALVSQTLPDDPWNYNSQLPTLLHICVTLVDHRSLYVRSQMRLYLFQILRGWSISFFHVQHQLDAIAVISEIDRLQEDAELFWSTNPKAAADASPKLARLCQRLVELLQPLIPDIQSQWANVAGTWGNRCTVRDLACKSLEILRVLGVESQPNIAHAMIERLATTASDITDADTKFAREAILTLIEYTTASTTSDPTKAALFWCATACLWTAVEAEFELAVSFLTAVVSIMDLRDPVTVEYLRANKPLDWITGIDLSVERLVYFGLRSSATVDGSYALLSRLAETAGHDVVEANDSRLRHLYTASLPACLHLIEDGVQDESIVNLATSIAALAEEEGRTDISRIMTSVAKNRFKRKEDFLRQAASTLRDNYWNENANELLKILLGCVLNTERWVQTKALQLLKALLQGTVTKNPFTLGGSELLLPLLKLLSSDLASDAMEVLDTPMIVSGGPSASNVVRMSIHGLLSNEAVADTVVFGTSARPSGWSVPAPEEQTMSCRRHIAAVASSSLSLVKHPSATFPTVLFTHDVDPNLPNPDQEVPASHHRSQPSADAISLGELVNTLHDLSNFFQSDMPTDSSSRSNPQFDDQDDAAKRVAAILSRSMARSNKTDAFYDPGDNAPIIGDGGYVEGNDPHPGRWVVPPTPFVDLFQVDDGASSKATASEALHMNFMRTAEESDGEDDYDDDGVARSDIANDHAGNRDRSSRISYDTPSRGATPRTRIGNLGHHERESQSDWDSEDSHQHQAFYYDPRQAPPSIYEGFTMVNTPDVQQQPQRWPGGGLPQSQTPGRGSVRKMKDILSPRRGSKEGRM